MTQNQIESRPMQVMKNLGRLLHSPDQVTLARTRKLNLEQERSLLSAGDSPGEYDRLSTLIDLEEDFIRFMSERAAEIRRQDYSVSAKGILQLLGLSVLVMAAIGFQSYFFG